jgi:hypothetical protein
MAMLAWPSIPETILGYYDVESFTSEGEAKYTESAQDDPWTGELREGHETHRVGLKGF